MSILEKQIENFTNYLNSFYGIQGIYSSGRNVNNEEVYKAIKIIQKRNEYEFTGDSVDREEARDIIYTEEEIIQMYKKYQ